MPIENLIKKLKKDKDIVAIAVFGSYLKRKKYRDIDICIIMSPKIKNRTSLFKKRLRYSNMLPENVDLQIYQLLPIYIRIRVLKEGKVIFCRNEDNLYSIATDTVKEYATFEPHYRRYLEVASEC